MKEKKKTLISAYSYMGLPLVACLAVNFLVYSMIAPMTDSWKHYDLTTAFDRAVPVIPEFVIIYLGCYIFWVVNYILIAAQGKEYCYRFATADIMARIPCCLFFLILPTTNVRPMLTDGGICAAILQFVYDMDAPTRLFPSIHCLVSWFCYIGIRRRENIPKWYQIFSCIFALLVCASTQFTKQHYIVDVFGGIIIAEVTYYISFHTNGYRLLEGICDRIQERICKRGK